MAVSHCIEHQTGWRIKKFFRTARRYRTVKINAGRQILTAADPYPPPARSDHQNRRLDPATLWLTAFVHGPDGGAGHRDRPAVEFRPVFDFVFARDLLAAPPR